MNCKESWNELDQVGDWKLGQVFNSLSIFISSHVVVVYDGNRAAMKAKRLWHSTKREAVAIVLVGFQNRRISLLEDYYSSSSVAN